MALYTHIYANQIDSIIRIHCRILHIYYFLFYFIWCSPHYIPIMNHWGLSTTERSGAAFHILLNEFIAVNSSQQKIPGHFDLTLYRINCVVEVKWNEVIVLLWDMRQINFLSDFFMAWKERLSYIVFSFINNCCWSAMDIILYTDRSLKNCFFIRGNELSYRGYTCQFIRHVSGGYNSVKQNFNLAPFPAEFSDFC